MSDLIDNYFSKHLEIPWDEAVRLHKEYFTNYGLASTSNEAECDEDGVA